MREQGDAGDNREPPVQWLASSICHSNPESPRMRVKLQLVMYSDEGQEETVTDVITLDKNNRRIEQLGLTLAEAKQLLSTLQLHLLQHQVDTFLDTCSGAEIRKKLERLKWSLWHGQVDKALGKVDDLASAIAPFSETYARFTYLVKALSPLRTYIGNNRHLIPNYGQRYRNGEAIATGFVESTVNQVLSKRFCKKQQMQWSKPGAHLLLQTRVKTLDGELGTIFKRWYPDMNIEVEKIPAAA